MKKLISVATLAVALCGLVLTGCASKGGSKGAAAPSIPHPRAYVIDPADSVTELDMPFNSYGPNYQGTVDMWKFLKKDKPLAGDKVAIKGKVSSNLDIPNLVFYLVDNSAAANYWAALTGDSYILDMKAGVEYDIDVEVTLDTSSKAALVLCFAYDGSDHGQESAPKVGKAAKFTFTKVADTTDTAAELLAAGPAAPKNLNIEVEKYAAFCEIATNHPWINGVQDMSVISNYQATPDFTNAFGDDLPVAGETVHISWSGVSDMDIEKLYMRPVDCSAAANWWKELIDFKDGDEGIVFAENIKAGEPFLIEKDFTIKYDPVGQFNLCIWYDYDGTGPGPCFIKLSKRPDAK